MRLGIALVTVVTLANGCVGEWRTQRAIEPITHTVPAYRRLPTVGNLRRLAVLPVRVSGVGPWGLFTYWHAIDAGPRYEALCTHLEANGYEIVRLTRSAEGSGEELVREWEDAATVEARAAIVRRLGRSVQVDGIVTAWMTDVRNEGILGIPLVIAGVTLNLALANLPLAYAAARIDREVAVYETASGDLVWRGYVRGGQLGNPSASLIMACADMEYAIPTVLVVPRPMGGAEPTDD